jgi:subtilisin family serine protease
MKASVEGLWASVSLAVRSRLQILVAMVLATAVGCARTSNDEGNTGERRAQLTNSPGAGAKKQPPITTLPVAPGGKKTAWVVMKQQANLTQARATKDWKARGQAVYLTLTTTANASQAALSSSLTARAVQHEKFWIVNALKVVAEQGVLDELARRSDVAKVVADKKYEVPPIRRSLRKAGTTATEWGLDNIGAPRVWSELGVFGDGIVVGSIDTGVEYTHPALVQQYRGSLGAGSFDHNYNWFDPANVCGFPSSAPCDNVAHGTHTVGTMVGDDHAGNQIGVAPHAKWIAAKGCETNSCSLDALLAAGQWMLAPTDLNGLNPRPDLRPHVINNSWGGGSGDEFYRPIVQAWTAAGIFPVFSSGNSGPSCGSAGSPGDYPESFAVGAHDSGNGIADFSGRGPAVGGVAKPDVTAPGVFVRSSVPGSGYDFFDGTSMAAPHVAGAVALLWSGSEALLNDVEATRALLGSSATDTSDLSCGGTPEHDNVFGRGRLNAFAAVEQSPRGPTGLLAGAALNGAGAPISATIVASNDEVKRGARADAGGAYQLRLPVGTYDVTVSAFGYVPQTVSGVVIVEEETTTQDFGLLEAPSFSLSGVVLDATGAPLAGATVSVDSAPLAPTLSAEDGSYSFAAVPAGNYVVRAALRGCFEEQATEVEVSGAVQLDFTLPQKVDSFGYSCRPGALEFIEATNPVALSGDDDVVTVGLPFAFHFYGSSYDQVSITTNGWLSFAGPSTSYFNTPLPDPSEPNGAVYAFWDDLFVGDNSSVLTEVIGTAPHRAFVVEWRDVELLGQPGVPLTFEAVLHENGQVSLLYRTLGSGSAERGGAATVGLEDATGSSGFQYLFEQPSLSDGLAVSFTAPPYALVRGSVVDVNDGAPVAGAAIEALVSGARPRSAVADSAGRYQLAVPEGEATLRVTSGRYEGAEVTLTVVDGEVYVRDFALRSAKGRVAPGALKWTVLAGQARTALLSLTSEGSIPLTFDIAESGGGKVAFNPTRLLAKSPSPPRGAPNTRSLFKAGVTAAGMAPTATGDVLFSFVPTINQAWGIGYTGSLWLSEFSNLRNHEYTTDGIPTGRSWQAPVPGIAAGDMAYDEGRNLVCQVDIEGDNGIHCFDPATGAPAQSIVGPFPWSSISQRGLAYRADDDSFYIGGWNSGVIYHVAGLGSAVPGTVLGSCSPPDGNISGLAYNPSAETLWVATNSPTDTIYQVAPDDCTVLATLPHPSPGFNGAGLEMDSDGNLWLVTQGTNTIQLMESGVPTLVDVPWLGVTPSRGNLPSGATTNLAVTVNSSGLAPGQYLATVLVRTNAAREPVLRVPVSLIVTDYQRAINAGGSAYLDSTGEAWVADKKWSAGGWGYYQKGSTLSTSRSIAGTTDDTLYQQARVDPYAYRFDNVPNGIYEVDLRFAEIDKLGKKRRVFDVVIEDSMVLPAHDIEYEAGRFAADDNVFFLPVTDQRLDVRFIARAGFALPAVNAIRVTRRPDK